MTCVYTYSYLSLIANKQRERIQYDSCNASAGSGVFHYNGLCFPENPALLTLTEASQPLENTVNFMNNQVYFLTSRYSNSEIGSHLLSICHILIVIDSIWFSTPDEPSNNNNVGRGVLNLMCLILKHCPTGNFMTLSILIRSRV